MGGRGEAREGEGGKASSFLGMVGVGDGDRPWKLARARLERERESVKTVGIERRSETGLGYF